MRVAPTKLHRCASWLLVGIILFALLARGFAAGAEYKYVRIEASTNAVLVRLPLTDVTGKVRVKERAADGFGLPVAPLKTLLGKEHYLEWQIGYDSPNTNSPSAVPEISFTRKGETKYGHELSKILLEAVRVGILSTNDIARELAILPRLTDKSFEDHETIQIEAAKNMDDTGFARAVQRVPQFMKSTEYGFVQIQLKQKQRAVGYQAMIYACLPMNLVLNTAAEPRKFSAAQSKETVYYRFDRTNADFLLDIVHAFGMASHQHNEDIQHILEKILEVQR